MIFHSIIPPEVVFDIQNEEMNSKNIEIEYLGETVIVSAESENTYIINRIISTSPKAFLNPALQPGTMIKGNWNNQS